MNVPVVVQHRRRTVASLVVGLAVVVALAVVTGVVDAQEPLPSGGAVQMLAERVERTDTEIGLSGVEAVEALDESGATELAADSSGLEPTELVDELMDDPTMFVTGDAMVGFLEEASASELSAAEALAASTFVAPVGVDVFELDSRPSSGLVLYLDVDGHVTTDGQWDTSRQFPTTSAPYVDPRNLSAAERDAVYEIWRRVSEDFSPFDVNVTTRDPGVEGLRKTSPADRSYGQRVVISPTNWTGAQTLGIALLDVFDESVDYPAFVFSSGRTPRVIAETVSHEAGHTLGLRHDGTTTGAEYYEGHGDWASIMGRPVSTSALITQWSKGEYPNANNLEDDVVEIATYTGFREDDVVCTRMIGSSSTTAGTIDAGADVDVFAVDLGGGPATISVRPALVEGTDLHAGVTVFAPDGASTTARPTVASNWTSAIALNVSVPGRYVIEVAPTAWLTPATGFSTYGSMGAYILQVSGTSGAGGPAPVCDPTSGFTPVTPTRLLDTRTGIGGARRIPAGGQIALQVSGRGGIPVGASAAVLSVVAVDPTSPGFLTTYPCTATRPTASTVNYVAGQIVANTVISTLSAGGRLCVYAHAATDVVVDVTGWLGQGSRSKFNPTGPERVMDTRIGQGGATRLGAGATVRLELPNVSPEATAVALNVTSDAASGPGFATVYPCAAGRPATSTINFVAGDTRPNNTIVGVDGGVCVYSMTSTELIVDLVGYFAPDGLSYLPTSPTRLIDTRETVGNLAPGATVTYRPGAGSPGSYVVASAAVNVTAVDHAAPGFVTTFGCVTRGTTSSVNAVVGQVNANGALVPVRNGLDSCLFTQSGGNLVVDLNGWWVR